MVSKSIIDMFWKPVRTRVFINSHPMPPAPTINMFLLKVSSSVDKESRGEREEREVVADAIFMCAYKY